MLSGLSYISHFVQFWQNLIYVTFIVDFFVGLFVCYRYVHILGNMVHDIQIKTKLCQLVEIMMERRDDLSFCQEMKFRYNKTLL